MARKLIITLLAIPLVVVMASKNPEGAAAGAADLIRLGAQLLDKLATAANDFLVGITA